MNHYAVYLKLTQHCKSTKFKKKKSDSRDPHTKYSDVVDLRWFRVMLSSSKHYQKI